MHVLLRLNLTTNNNDLMTLEDTLEDSVGRIESARNEIDVVNQRVMDVKRKAEELRNNATGVKALDPAGKSSKWLFIHHK